jgi:hypothetical protein
MLQREKCFKEKNASKRKMLQRVKCFKEKNASKRKMLQRVSFESRSS